eukprot:TRINITY_DN2307_c0_g1_i1.p1 TRINITY_DN2307_c0_g1~~TRINITY_DN2307_c0_g1_i1.p1  ORF type:complete len:365 (+),score=42.40 TRINITY_DN2307_c0_g1_i1:80-1174(+)
MSFMSSSPSPVHPVSYMPAASHVVVAIPPAKGYALVPSTSSSISLPFALSDEWKRRLATIYSFIISKLAECTPGGSRWRHLLIIPLFIYFILYSTFPVIPDPAKLPVNVSGLVNTERYIFGGILPHEVLSWYHNSFFDVMAAIPYGLHIPLPIIFLTIALIWERRLVLPYAHSLGIASLAGVVIQYVFPTSPPWYYEKYGELPAHYDMQGDPAGLARVDVLLGTSFFHDMFEQSAIVFGSFPSLHITWASLMCLYLCSFQSGSKRGRFCLPFALWKCLPPLYVIWLALAVVYLEHHYVLDVAGGFLLALIAFGIGMPWSSDKEEEEQTDKVSLIEMDALDEEAAKIGHKLYLSASECTDSSAVV